MATLVLYAGKYGNTAKCAEALAKKLKGQVDVKPLTDNMPELTGYDTVVLGASMYAGNMRKEMKAFASTFLDTLLKKKIALFVCCMAPNETEVYLKASLPETLVTQAVSKERLGGGFAYSKMKGFERFIIKRITLADAKKTGKPVETDFKTDFLKLDEEALERMATVLNG